LENAQKELLNALLERLLARGLIPESIFQSGRELVSAAQDLPDFFSRTAAPEGAAGHGRSSDPL